MGDIKPGRRLQVRRAALLGTGVLLTGCGIAAAASLHGTPTHVRTTTQPADRLIAPPPSLNAAVRRRRAVPQTTRAAVYLPRPVDLSPPTLAGVPVQGQTLQEQHGSWANQPTAYGYQWLRCDNAGGSCVPIRNANSQTYTLEVTDVGSTIRLEELASNASGSGSGATSAATAVVTAPTIPPPPPVLARTGTATVISGRVLIRLRGTNRFIALTGGESIPVDSELDTTGGHARITVATGHGRSTASAEVSGGRFLFTQRSSGLARFALTLPLTGCAATAGRGRAAAHHGAKSRRLWVSEHGGHWATHGRYVATTVEGTRWLTLDECARSKVEVAQGRVRVTNLLTGKITTVLAGNSLLAGPERKRA